MNIQMHNIVSARPVLQKLNSAILPIKTAYKISRLYKAIEKENEFYVEKLRAIVNDCAELVNGEPVILENGDIKLRAEKTEEANRRNTELMELEIEIPDITFSIDDFGDITIAPSELDSIAFIIND